jgi:hypothetical protein
MRLVFMLVASLLATPLVGAVRYVVTIEEGPGRLEGARRAYLVHGDRWRVEILDAPQEPRMWDVMLGRPDDEIGLDNARRAWWSDRREAERRSPGLLPVLREWRHPIPKQVKLRKTKISLRGPQPGPMVEGRETTVHELDFSTRLHVVIDRNRVDADLQARIRLWTVEGIPPVPAPLDLRNVMTLDPAIDALLREELGKVSGFVVRREIEVTRQLDPRHPVSARSVISVAEIDLQAAATDAAFTIPAGYTEAPPLLGAPGR